MPSEIHKHDGSTWRAITDPRYNDAGTIRDLSEVHYNDGGTWRQVFGTPINAETINWTASTPSGTYHSGETEIAFARFTASTTGSYFFSVEVPSSGDGAPLSGTYRPGITGVDGVNYEISINAGSVSGTGIKEGIGDGTDMSGAWQPLDVCRGISLFNTFSGAGVGTLLVTVEIREIATPANTSGISTFTLSINGTAIIN